METHWQVDIKYQVFSFILHYTLHAANKCLLSGWKSSLEKTRSKRLKKVSYDTETSNLPRLSVSSGEQLIEKADKKKTKSSRQKGPQI